jgi:hypothetical protein
MKRKNLQRAFIGTSNPMMEGLNVDDSESRDFVEYAVVGGTVRTLIPSDLPDSAIWNERWFEDFVVVELELEDGRKLTGIFQPPCQEHCLQIHLEKGRKPL